MSSLAKGSLQKVCGNSAESSQKVAKTYVLVRSRPGKPNQRKGQNEKFMNFGLPGPLLKYVLKGAEILRKVAEISRKLAGFFSAMTPSGPNNPISKLMRRKRGNRNKSR